MIAQYTRPCGVAGVRMQRCPRESVVVCHPALPALMDNTFLSCYVVCHPALPALMGNTFLSCYVVFCGGKRGGGRYEMTGRYRSALELRPTSILRCMLPPWSIGRVLLHITLSHHNNMGRNTASPSDVGGNQPAPAPPQHGQGQGMIL